MRRRNMECSVCGKFAGKWHQWFNQDSGVSICRECQDWQLSTGKTTTGQLRENFGIAGVNRPISIQDRIDALEEKISVLEHEHSKHEHSES